MKTSTNFIKSSAICSLCFMLALSSCKDEPVVDGNDKLKEATTSLLLAVANKNADSVCTYFQSDAPSLRLLAIRHAASINDSTMTSCLLPLLRDSSTAIRSAAVYSLSLHHDSSAANSIYRLLENETNTVVRSACFKAIGRNGSFFSEEQLWQIISDEDCGAAPLWMNVYANAFNDRRVIDKAFEHLRCDEAAAIEAAAQILSRCVAPMDVEACDHIITHLQNSNSLDIKTALIRSLKNAHDSLTLPVTLHGLDTTKDERIIAEHLRLAGHNGLNEPDILFPFLEHEAPGIPELAFTLLKNSSFNAEQLAHLENLTDQSNEQGSAYASLLLAIRDKGKGPRLEQLIGLCAQLDAPYLKAKMVSELGAMDASSYLRQQLFDAHAVIRTAAAEALIESIRHEEAHPNPLADENQLIVDLLNTKDAGIAAVVCDYLLGSSGLDEKVVKQLQTLHSTLNSPEDAESILLIQSLFDRHNIAYTARKTDAHRRLSAETVSSFEDTVHAKLQFSEGEVELILFPLLAPESVSSFVHLANRGYYNGKAIHRVVPNFVAQGGCPRGDGWGGIDYTIHSELAIENFTEGSVGMASAGRDSESCQWFITHCATPHLNGRYTKFGEVRTGMEVVRMLRQGSVIRAIELY